MTALLARLRRPADTAAFDRRLVAPMILGSLLTPVNSSLIAVAPVPIGGLPPERSRPRRVLGRADATFFHLGGIAASTTGGHVFAHGATTAGVHHLAPVMLAAAVLFGVITVADRSLGRLTPTEDPS